MRGLLRDAAARRAYFLVSGLVLVLDQATKLAADRWLRGRGIATCDDVPSRFALPDSGCVEIVPQFFNLWYSLNRGGLFGYFRDWSDPWRTIVLTLIPLAAIVLIAVFLARTDEPHRSTLFGLALILGGATGNLVDRVLRGEVVDFLDVYASAELMPGLAGWFVRTFHTAHWPTFNVADSAIVCGACLLILDIFRSDERAVRAAEPS